MLTKISMLVGQIETIQAIEVDEGVVVISNQLLPLLMAALLRKRFGRFCQNDPRPELGKVDAQEYFTLRPLDVNLEEVNVFDFPQGAKVRNRIDLNLYRDVREAIIAMAFGN